MIPTTAAVRALFMGANRQVMRITLDSDALVSDTVYAVLDDSTETELTTLALSDNTEIQDTFVLWKNYIQSASAGLEISQDDILVGGFVYDNYSMSTERIEIGSAIAAELTLKLQNYDGTFDSVRFEGVEMYVELGVKDWDTDDPISWIPLGYFTADKQPKNLTSVSVIALDRMIKFDHDLDWSQFTFPITLQNIVQQTCTICGVTLDTDLTTLPNYNYQITYSPEVTASYRNIIQWAAFLTGTCAQINEAGELVFKWYSDCSLTITSAERFSHEIEEEDVTLTGLYYKSASGIEYLQGTADYALEYSGCELLQNNVETALANIWTAVSGFSYRPFSAVLQSCPFLQPLDMITFTDKDGNDQICIISKITYTGNQNTPVSGPGESATVASYASLSGLTSEQKLQVDDAKRQATNYLSMDATGIMIANMTDGTRYTPSEIPDGIKNTFIDEDSFEVRDGTDVIATFGETSRIGPEDSNNLVLTPSSLNLVNEEAVDVFNITTAGGTITTDIGYYIGRQLILLSSAPTSKVFNCDLDDYNINTGYFVRLILNTTYVNPSTHQTTFLSHKKFECTAGTAVTLTDSDTYVTYEFEHYSNHKIMLTATLTQAGIALGTVVKVEVYRLYTRGTMQAPSYSLGTRVDTSPGGFSVIAGDNLSAETYGQFACGKYNAYSADYAVMAGNGSSSGESNAFAVTWDGDLLCDIDTEVVSGDDYTLYSLITAYGWEEEVIVDA